MTKRMVFIQIVDGTREDFEQLKKMLANTDYDFVMGRKPIASVSREELVELIKKKKEGEKDGT